jgi:hypothetical protein
MTQFWKSNWRQTMQHFIDWWNHEGLLLYIWGVPGVDHLHEEVVHHYISTPKAVGGASPRKLCALA